MNRKYQYDNRWSNFIFWAVIVALMELIFTFSLLNMDISENIQLAILVLSLNFASMIFTGCLMMAYIHYKSPHYEIIVDKDMIIIPKNSIIPDSYFIHYSDIIYINQIGIKKSMSYQIIFSGGTVEIKKELLKNPHDIDEIVYYLKEAAL